MDLCKNNFITLILDSPSCSYLQDEIFYSTDQISEKDKDFVRNCIYRQELLNIFGLEEFDEKKMELNMGELFKFFENDNNICELLEILFKKYSFSKEECFMILFSFDFFHATLECLKDYFKNGYISIFHHQKLKQIIIFKE